ncbi:hypothetical protein D0Y65_009814 [Glycine soja]|uniref:Uncharacterized protein n=1 Tax=Glycine soja TaxID=3848 RepID=A0A445L0L8_GLYSO|nr:hypothetical protein D0Y65_009814 [Glycine soja]
MYVTRPLSLYKKSANGLPLPPPEGPNSGILVIQDQDLEPTSCFGLGEEYHEVKELPFPQNLNLELFYRSGISLNRTTHHHHVAFIPVLNQPLPSNKYYVINLSGKKRGLRQASGVSEALRAIKPEFKFSLAKKSSESVVVGKWYCPFMFIKEGTHKTWKEEMRKSMFYEMTLEQKWEQIFSSENEYGMQNTVNVDAVVQKEVVIIAGWEAVINEMNMCFNNVGEKSSVGLSTAVVERMKWEQERVGWNGEEKQIRVKKVEEFKCTNGWKKFGCRVFVETFVLKTLEGSIVLTYAFRHHDQLWSKWE